MPSAMLTWGRPTTFVVQVDDAYGNDAIGSIVIMEMKLRVHASDVGDAFVKAKHILEALGFTQYTVGKIEKA